MSKNPKEQPFKLPKGFIMDNTPRDVSPFDEEEEKLYQEAVKRQTGNVPTNAPKNSN